MPIRINLMAEAQAAEELRRKDPVKRGIMVASLLVAAVVVWAGALQCKIIASKSELKGLETKWASIEKGYQVAVESQRKGIEAERKLSALQQLTTNRFLWGSTLNAIQQSLSGEDGIQFVRLRTDQTYVTTEEAKPRPNDPKAASAKAASATEKVTFTIEAMDFSSQPGGHVNKYKEAIAAVPYLKDRLQRTNGVLLTSLSAPQLSPTGKGTYVLFTLQCYFPEITR